MKWMKSDAKKTQKVGGRERRSYPRLEGKFVADLLNMGDDPAFFDHELVIPGEARDLSRQGIRLESHYNVSVGMLISVVIYYRHHESVCLSEVVWKKMENGGYLYGLHFREWSHLDPLLAKALNAMEADDSASSRFKGALFPSPGFA